MALKPLSSYQRPPARLVSNTGYFMDNLKAAFAHVAAQRAYEWQVLGQVGGHDIVFLTPAQRDPAKKDILIAGGFHGIEPAGSWGICSYLEQAGAADLNAVNISFLPLVNPTGFDRNERYNIWDENPNEGFPDGSEHAHLPRSREGDILLRHIDVIFNAARDGCISLHEDSKLSRGYVWSYEPDGKPGPFSLMLRDCIGKHFALQGNRPVDHGDGGDEFAPQDSLILNAFDSTFESYLYTRGSRYVATPETPVKAPVKRRIECNADLVRGFARFVANAP